jgi:hypothetical protein
MKLGYENTDKKIEVEIYGIPFEIKNVDKMKQFEDVEDDDLNGLEEILETLLGEGAIEKLNNQREKDGYKKIDSTIALNLLVGISDLYMNTYTENIMQPLEKSAERINKYNKKFNRYNRRKRGNYGKY